MCGVSRRTIFRDLEALRIAGIPLEFDEELERYHIPTTFLLPPTNFSGEKALAVIALCHELGASGQLPYYEAARSAALKLESSLPASLRDNLRLLTWAIRINLGQVVAQDGQKGIYQQLVDAAARRRAVRIRYQSLTEWEEIRTKLYPYQVMFSRRSWYVTGRSPYHRATRTFSVARVTQLESLEEPFKIPRGFSIDRYRRNAWHLIPERGPNRHVVVRFQKMVATNVAEVAWHASQRTEFRKDGTMDFHVTVSGLSEISWWILGYGDQAEVLDPPELRKMVAEHARRMLATYQRRKTS